MFGYFKCMPWDSPVSKIVRQLIGRKGLHKFLDFLLVLGLEHTTWASQKNYFTKLPSYVMLSIFRQNQFTRHPFEHFYISCKAMLEDMVHYASQSHMLKFFLDIGIKKYYPSAEENICFLLSEILMSSLNSLHI